MYDDDNYDDGFDEEALARQDAAASMAQLVRLHEALSARGR